MSNLHLYQGSMIGRRAKLPGGTNVARAGVSRVLGLLLFPQSSIARLPRSGTWRFICDVHVSGECRMPIASERLEKGPKDPPDREDPSETA